jgi:hypothetical protein
VAKLAASRLAEAEDPAAAAAKADLPPGWAAVFSKSKQCWYWRDEASGATAWEKPSFPGAAAAGSAAADGEAEANAGLPAGWAAVWSRSKERWYWRRGGETSWTKPSE